MNYSFDYDNTLIKYKYIYSPTGEIIDVVYDRPHDQNIDIVRELHESGHNIYIITSRIKPIYEGFRYEWDESPSPEKLVKELSLPIKQIVYTKFFRTKSLKLVHKRAKNGYHYISGSPLCLHPPTKWITSTSSRRKAFIFFVKPSTKLISSPCCGRLVKTAM